MHGIATGTIRYLDARTGRFESTKIFVPVEGTEEECKAQATKEIAEIAVWWKSYIEASVERRVARKWAEFAKEVASADTLGEMGEDLGEGEGD